MNNEWCDVYLVVRDSDLSTLRLQKEEVSAVRWIPWRELERIITVGDPTFVLHPEEYKKLFAVLHKRYGKEIQ